MVMGATPLCIGDKRFFGFAIETSRVGGARCLLRTGGPWLRLHTVIRLDKDSKRHFPASPAPSSLVLPPPRPSGRNLIPAAPGICRSAGQTRRCGVWPGVSLFTLRPLFELGIESDLLLPLKYHANGEICGSTRQRSLAAEQVRPTCMGRGTRPFVISVRRLRLRLCGVAGRIQASGTGQRQSGTIETFDGFQRIA